MKKVTLAVLTIALSLFLVSLACSKGPQPPQLIYPEDGAILLNLPFTWSTVPEAENYLFEIATDQVFASVILDEVLTNTTYQIQNTEIFQTGITMYYWHVYSGDGKGWGDASETWMFTITSGGKF
ncbi:MAG: hypothetical protein E3J71_03940 [Candidatus Stahlbacteria bacterium]|nr:MAG: hypothetical protein E3J71_03940 [Candidatus Stahlbacteria bacterium]